MFELALFTGIIIVVLALFAEYMDSTLGMGYGTSLTPILMLMGFEPLQIVPAILLSELFTGLLAGLMHARVGNVEFRVKTFNPAKIKESIKEHGLINALKLGLSLHLKIALLIATFSIIGSIIGANVALNIPKFYLKLYIGLLVLSMGIYILITYNKKFKFTWSKLSSIAVLASFNKGISGGGYGPVVTGGQIL